MANPHRDAGYTGIAHELILAMARVGFSGREWDVLMIILRETYGVHIKRAADPKKRWLKENELSSRYISWLTGLHDSAVRHVLRSLEKENVIVVTAGAGKPNVYGINKHYEKWNRKPRPTASPESAPKITKPDNYKNYLRGIRGGSEPSNSSVGEHLLRDTSDPGGGTPATRGV